MASPAHSYEFNAPKHFFDFNKGDIEVDESYFDTASDTPQKPSSETMRQQSPKIPVSLETEHQPSVKAPATPKAKPKRISHIMAGLETVGVRQSPRLAAIAKALRRSKAAKKAIREPGRSSRLQTDCRPRTRQRAVPRVSGVRGLSVEDEADLHAIANFSHKTSKGVTQSESCRPAEHEDSRLQSLSTAAVSEVPITASHPAVPSYQPGPIKTEVTGSQMKVSESSKGGDQECVDFPKLHAGISSLKKDAVMGRTVPQPFKFTESHRVKTEGPNKFVSVAELNLMFHTKTPQRFRSKRAGGEINEDAKRAKPNPPGITIPHTPQLTTSRRGRTVSYLSREEIELKAFEEAQKQAFKARPVNKKILEGPSASHRVEKKPPTVPEPFNITDTKKAEAASLMKKEAACERANELSVPLSQPGKKSAVKVQPFSFHSRDKVMLEQKQEKIKKVIEEEKHLAEFHARPMPTFASGVMGVPPKKPPTPTQTQPFNFQADLRGTVKQEKFKAQLEEESHLDAKRRRFHAQPGNVVHKAPFVPEKSKRPLTAISGFTLNTELQAGRRSEFEHRRKMHEEEILATKKQEEARQAAEEAAEIARLRQEAVHKANPAPKFKPVVLQLPHRPVTIPKTPNFATESRIRSRPRLNSTLDVSSATYTAE